MTAQVKVVVCMSDKHKETVMNKDDRASPGCKIYPFSTQAVKPRIHSNFEDFQHNLKQTYAHSGLEVSCWLKDVRLVLDWVYRFHRHEIWVKESVSKMSSPLYRIYEYIVLLYSLYGAYPGRSSLIVDITSSLSDLDKNWENLIIYKAGFDDERYTCQAEALWTLWDDIVNVYLPEALKAESFADKLEISTLRPIMFYGLTSQYEESLLDGERIITTKLAKKWLSDTRRVFDSVQ